MTLKKLSLALLTAFAASACTVAPGKPEQEQKSLNMPVAPYHDLCDGMKKPVCWGQFGFMTPVD